jgi:hypothetical protein
MPVKQKESLNGNGHSLQGGRMMEERPPLMRSGPKSEIDNLQSAICSDDPAVHDNGLTGDVV